MTGDEVVTPSVLGAENHAALVASLLDELAAAGVTEAELSFDGLRVRVRRRPGFSAGMGLGPSAPPESAEAPREGWAAVVAPLAGVFYNREAPDAEPFARVGAALHLGQPVGLIESMKMFNEVIADVQGIVQEILVANGEIVHAGQPLLYVELNDAVGETPPHDA